MVYLFLADGFEDIEAVGTIDILRRAGITVNTVSISGTKKVASAHGIEIMADCLFSEINGLDAELLVLPGGAGHKKLAAFEPLNGLLREFDANKKYIAAICAAPSILGGLGILDGKKAVCYPGFEGQLKGAVVLGGPVAVDGNIISSRGPGTVFLFALEIVKTLKGGEAYNEVKGGLLL
ncbi:MAG: DJ-1/PfpI family protein [Clostridiales bacterium]|jgi:4-methyl-5(b-hydroxyethyl)-thiazole monophosphate biosynthesis|nr:DJ-1/PfpI family protein [Clostridiales bacterium]